MKPYKIKRYSYNQAKKLDVSIYPSTKPNKKIDIYKDGIYITSIGAMGMSDYPSYVESEGKKYADENLLVKISKTWFFLQIKNI